MAPTKILIVGHCHPNLPHVCALRTKGFAEGLARRGHEVVLLTGALPDATSMPHADTVIARLSQRGGSGPLVLGCLPRGHGWSRRARHGRFPPILNKAVLTGSFMFHGGLFSDWVAGSKPYWPVLADQWRPDVVWATFGNTGAWLIAQGIARRAGCPWVMDMKDPWPDFIPAPIRRLLAARFGDAAAATALADIHGDDLRRWFRRDAVTVPSGVDIPDPDAPAAVAAPGRNPDGHPDGDSVRISLVGSLYGDDDLKTLLAGIRAWGEERRGQPGRSVRPAILNYFGAEDDRLVAGTTEWGNICEVRTCGFVPPAELAQRLRTSHINAFVNARTGFRHKVLEFAVAGRPILCLPGGGADETAIVRQAGGTLHNCATAADVKGVLDELDRNENAETTAPIDIERFSWNARAAALEAVFEQVVK
jgi:glycosyltransferase involved in cell wall biosynthesis